MITIYKEIESGLIQRTDVDGDTTTSYSPVRVGDNRTDTDSEGNETTVDLWQEALDAGAVMLSDESKAATLAESNRQAAKAVRDSSLNSLTYTFQDGRELQTRPIDAQNIQTAISLGESIEFVCADNSIHLFTVLELQEALTAGIIEGKAIWSLYIDTIR